MTGDAFPLLSGLAPDLQSRIVSQCRGLAVPAGREIIGAGDASGDVFLLAAGTVRVSVHSAAGQLVSFRDAGPGEVLGEVSALDGGQRTASVTAVTDCRLLRLGHAPFLALLAAEPAFALAVMRHLAGLVRDLSARLQSVTTDRADQRVRMELLRMSLASADAVLDPAPTHAEIAARIGTQREAVSRELARLAGLGLVRRQGRRLAVTDLDALRRLVAEGQG